MIKYKIKLKPILKQYLKVQKKLKGNRTVIDVTRLDGPLGGKLYLVGPVEL